jgi:hypothetical protein
MHDARLGDQAPGHDDVIPHMTDAVRSGAGPLDGGRPVGPTEWSRDNIQIGSKIGGGEFGDVFTGKATHASTGLHFDVVVKAVKTDLAGSQQQIAEENLCQEVRAHMRFLPAFYIPFLANFFFIFIYFF